MTLGVADDLAKASLRQSKASLTRDADFGRNMQLATKPAYSIGLGNRMSNLEAVSYQTERGVGMRGCWERGRGRGREVMI